MKEFYDFKLKKEFTEINPIKEDYRHMFIKIKIPCVSISCYYLNEFLAEIVCQGFSLDIDRFVSTKNILDLSAACLWAFGEESIENGYKQVITGPMGSSNSVFTDKTFYDFDIENNPELKKINFDESQIKCLNTLIIMHNGEKEISTELDHLKLFLKMHVFMLLFHFFTEGLPKYDIDDADLPNQYDNDIENAPKLAFKLYLNNSIICLDDLRDAIAVKLDLYFIYDRFNIKSLKQKL